MVLGELGYVSRVGGRKVVETACVEILINVEESRAGFDEGCISSEERGKFAPAVGTAPLGGIT